MTESISKVPGDSIGLLRQLEVFVLDRLTNASEGETDPAFAFVRERFLSLACDLELSVRTLAREVYRLRGELAIMREDAERRARTLNDLATANASLALVVATAIGWHQGRESDDELRQVVASLLEDPAVDEASKRLTHEDPPFRMDGEEESTP